MLRHCNSFYLGKLFWPRTNNSIWTSVCVYMSQISNILWLQINPFFSFGNLHFIPRFDLMRILCCSFLWCKEVVGSIPGVVLRWFFFSFFLQAKHKHKSWICKFKLTVGGSAFAPWQLRLLGSTTLCAAEWVHRRNLLTVTIPHNQQIRWMGLFIIHPNLYKLHLEVKCYVFIRKYFTTKWHFKGTMYLFCVWLCISPVW